PLDLVVHAPRLAQLHVLKRAEIKDRQPPCGRILDALLESNVAAVGRQRWAFHVGAQDPHFPLCQVTFDEVSGRADTADTQGGVKTIAIAGKRRAPEVEVRGLEEVSILVDREVLQGS